MAMEGNLSLHCQHTAFELHWLCAVKCYVAFPQVWNHSTDSCNRLGLESAEGSGKRGCCCHWGQSSLPLPLFLASAVGGCHWGQLSLCSVQVVNCGHTGRLGQFVEQVG